MQALSVASHERATLLPPFSDDDDGDADDDAHDRGVGKTSGLAPFSAHQARVRHAKVLRKHATQRIAHSVTPHDIVRKQGVRAFFRGVAAALDDPAVATMVHEAPAFAHAVQVMFDATAHEHTTPADRLAVLDRLEWSWERAGNEHTAQVAAAARVCFHAVAMHRGWSAAHVLLRLLWSPPLIVEMGGRVSDLIAMGATRNLLAQVIAAYHEHCADDWWVTSAGMTGQDYEKLTADGVGQLQPPFSDRWNGVGLCTTTCKTLVPAHCAVCGC